MPNKPANSSRASLRNRPSVLSTFAKGSTREVVFYVNGVRVALDNPDPALMLVDYLRSPEVGLTGTKIGCKEGGCGGCTVLRSEYDPKLKKVVHMASNSCLRPLPTVDGASFTTVEGMGSTKTRLNPVQYGIAAGNGSQCGFCTPGMVMSMCSLLVENPKPSLRDVEDALDGNLCRCTGYRPILEAFGRFAGRKPSEAQPMIRSEAGFEPFTGEYAPSPVLEPTFRPSGKNGKSALTPPAFPKELIERARHPKKMFAEGSGVHWCRPLTLADALRLKNDAGSKGIYVQGSTSAGIFGTLIKPGTVLVDIAGIPELQGVGFRSGGALLHIGGAATITQVLRLVGTASSQRKGPPQRILTAMHDILKQVANRHIRNLGSVTGNLTLVRKHAGTSEPFPSDVFTTLAALGAILTAASASWKKPKSFPLDEYVSEKLPADFMLTGISVPLPRNDSPEWYQVYKVARRSQNSHSLVNAGLRVRLDHQNQMAAGSATFIFGGISDRPVRARETETWMEGKPWTEETLRGVLPVLQKEIHRHLAELPNVGVPAAYRQSLAENLFYKFFVHVALNVAPREVSKEVQAAGHAWEVPLSRGQEHYQVFPDEAPVSEPIVKLTAFTQASGEAKYTQDLPAPPRTLHGAFAVSTQALAAFEFHPSLDKAIARLKKEFPGVRDVITARDIPNPKNNIIGIGSDDPVFAPGQVTASGQPLALVLAETDLTAIAAALYLQQHCVRYQSKTPVLTIAAALALPNKQGIFEEAPPTASFLTYIQTLERPHSDQEWLKDPSHLEPGTRVVSGRQRTGAQAHFYMETQAVLAIPGESGAITVHAGTQDPNTLQNSVAQVLSIPTNAVTIGVGLVGGAFGGKTTRVPFVGVPAALAAMKHQLPVRLVLPRKTDTGMIGKRHPLDGLYHAMFTNNGLVKGYRANCYVDAGNTYDCTFFVLDEMQLNGDGAYQIPTYSTEIIACRTNQASNTAVRSFGVTQVSMVREDAMEHVAFALGMLPEDVREKNLYRTGTATEFDETPYGEDLKDCDVRGLWSFMRKSSDFDAREREIREFNGKNVWRKRGISMVPLKYGIGYSRRMLNQGRAIVNVYQNDGSMLLLHGGVEMGQGIHTKMAQLLAHALNVPLNLIRVAESNTRAVGNAMSTGASTGADLNGGAVNKAGKLLRKRLEDMCLELREKHGEQFCIDNGIDYWRYKEGWQAQVTVKGSTSPSLMWINVVSQAFDQRVDLTSEAFYKTPHLKDVSGKYPHGRPYLYYTYGVACSEVEIDVLTGQSMVLRADVLYENAKSLNAALDIGQVQGGFVQGIGNMTCEQVFTDDAGRLLSYGTWEYKPPFTLNIPRDFRVTLLRRAPLVQQREGIVDPEALEEGTAGHGKVLGRSAVQSSRTSGEPPFVMATSVFFAIKHAILSARRDRGEDGWFELDAPATVQVIQQACLVQPDSLSLRPDAKASAAQHVKASSTR